MFTHLMRFLPVVMLVSSIANSSACNSAGQIPSRCPSGCTVQTWTFWNSLSGDVCYKNLGSTINCPSPCDGEYVFTAESAGDCDQIHNYCNWWVRFMDDVDKKASRKIILAKLYVPDCDGQMETLVPFYFRSPDLSPDNANSLWNTKWELELRAK